MRKLFITLFLVVFAAGNIFAANAVRLLPKERWTMSEDGQFAYATQISSDSITLQIELFSPQLKMQSQTAGLLAYIDLTGKKKEKYHVAFPVVKGLIEQMMPRQNQGEEFGKRPEEERQKRRGAANAPMIDFDALPIPASVRPVLIDDSYASLFINKDEQMLSSDDVTLSYTDGRLFYSMKLPRAKFGKKLNKKGVCSIAVAIRELAKPAQKSGGMTPPEGGMGGRPGGGMGGHGGGMGGRPGGGMGGPGGGMGGRHGGGMGGPDGSSSPRNQQYKQWLSVNCQ